MSEPSEDDASVPNPPTGEAEGETTEYPIPNPPHVQQPLIQTVVDHLNGVGDCPSTGESGMRTTWVMEQILAAHYGRRP